MGTSKHYSDRTLQHHSLPKVQTCYLAAYLSINQLVLLFLTRVNAMKQRIPGYIRAQRMRQKKKGVGINQPGKHFYITIERYVVKIKGKAGPFS
jgi:hypothetical protein